LLLISIFSTWYSIQGSNGGCGSTSFGLWLVQVSGCGQPSASGSFSNFNLPWTGQLYTVTLVLLLAGIIAVAVAATLTFARSRSGILTPPFWVALAVTILAISAPALVAFDQPSTVCADSESHTPPGNTPLGSYGPAWPCTWEFYFGNGVYSGSGQSGPTTSFRGAATFSGSSLQWGPDLGWYLAYAAGLIALAPTIAAARHDAKLRIPGSDAALRRPIS
jgi:hypothetical protein